MKVISAICNCILWKCVAHKSKPMSLFMVTSVQFFMWKNKNNRNRKMIHSYVWLIYVFNLIIELKADIFIIE